MSKTNDDLMYELLKAKREGTKIYYAPKGNKLMTRVEPDHCWDLAGCEYDIRYRREYIIRIDDRHLDKPVIEHLHNNWTRSDFGRDDMGEHILMREVYQDEM